MLQAKQMVPTAMPQPLPWLIMIQADSLCAASYPRLLPDSCTLLSLLMCVLLSEG